MCSSIWSRISFIKHLLSHTIRCNELGEGIRALEGNNSIEFRKFRHCIPLIQFMYLVSPSYPFRATPCTSSYFLRGPNMTAILAFPFAWSIPPIFPVLKAVQVRDVLRPIRLTEHTLPMWDTTNLNQGFRVKHFVTILAPEFSHRYLR